MSLINEQHSLKVVENNGGKRGLKAASGGGDRLSPPCCVQCEIIALVRQTCYVLSRESFSFQEIGISEV